MVLAHAEDGFTEKKMWCWLKHTDGETGPEGEIMIAPAIPVPGFAVPVVPVPGSAVPGAIRVYLCTRIISGAMPTLEIKLNYRRFSRTMIQPVMKVNFDFLATYVLRLI